MPFLRQLRGNKGSYHPNFADLHPSLANNEHVAWLINKVKMKLYPDGTDLAGMGFITPSIDCHSLIRLYAASKGALTREGVTLKIPAATCSASIGSYVPMSSTCSLRGLSISCQRAGESCRRD